MTWRKSHKFNAKPRRVDGHYFASTREAQRYGELKMAEQAGTIKDLTLQPTASLDVCGVRIGAYRGDFAYFDETRREWVWEDVKGVRTALYKLKKRMVKAQYGIEIQEV